ncbi:PilN domain-containing protein [Candidatus Gracilibacteria bacterium]|nr:PilN domain-containing protein [Candidatus Gracilibacteria bacterium]
MTSSQTNNKKITTSTILTLLFFTGTVVLSGSLVWQKYSLAETRTQLNESIKVKEALITDYSKKDLIGEKHLSQEILKKAESYRVIWSQKLKDVRTLENKNINFLSISLEKGAKVSISATANSKEAISKLIETIKSDPLFTNPFVSGFSESEIENQKNYKFLITFSYLK